jgi:hypothetical protein
LTGTAPARIFHRGDARRARRRDAMGVERFCQVQNESGQDESFSSKPGRENTATMKYPG